MPERKPKKPRAPAARPARKRAASEYEVKAGKQARVAPGTAPDRNEVLGRTVVWRFSEADHEGPWGFGSVSAEELLRKLSNFESMTVREVFFGSGPGKHYDIAELPGRTLQRLVDISRDDEDKLACLRFNGPGRIHGFLREHVFYVLWWDPRHEVYPSKLKHT